MERREGNVMTFHSSYNASILGDPTYRPILPYRMFRIYTMPPYQRQLLDQTRCYIRLACAYLFGFIFVLMLCLSPLNWVEFLVLTDKRKLSAGLWTLCDQEFCWSHTPKPPYYLQLSRAFFLMSALTVFIIAIWLTISLVKWPGDKSYIDLGISIFCFISGTCLLLCLLLFLMQVKSYSRNVMEPRFLLAYRLNWWGSIFYMIAGFISGLNHISSRNPSQGQNLLVIPITRTRIGNRFPMELGLNETNVDTYPRMNQVQERQLMRVAQPESQSESRIETKAGTQTESETKTEPEPQGRSETQTLLGTQAKPETQAESMTQTKPEKGEETVPRIETETTMGNVTSDGLGNRLEDNEND
ncbi:transmembrane protein 202 [Dasypus novemcinctus]|uniref:transmembrane protein 202 n=1 Tax=Dasypus novemcinctus TaxID=9361 RepID=UPI00265D7998|nr:transmembrane protein 202 [Dasypus novemcinctus]